MKKLILSTVITALSFGVQAERFDVIVKWKHHSDYLGAFDTPKQRLVRANKLKSRERKVAGNIHKTSPASEISDLSGLTLEHIRSGANRTDSYAVDAESFQKLQQKLMATGYFEYVSLNASYQLPPIKDEVLVSTKKLIKTKSKIANHSLSIEKNAFNDPYFSEQVVFQPQGKYTMGAGSFLEAMTYVSTNANNSQKIRVAVLDTGKWEHEDMTWSSDEANMVSGKSGAQCLSNDETNSGIDSICPMSDYIIGTRNNNAVAKTWRFTFDSDDNPISDGEVVIRGHGLAVSSMIAAKNNNGLGITSPNGDDTVELVPVRVFGTSTAMESDVIDGIYWASGMSVPGVDEISKPVDIINMSLGSSDISGCSDAKQEAVNYAVSQGVTVVIAAGNSSLDTQITGWACDNILSVGAHTLSGEITNFSNYGELVDVTMLGDAVMAASITTSLYTGTADPRTVEQGCSRDDGSVADNTGCYWTTSGTSIAAPLASALVAQIKKVRPELTPAELMAIIKNTALNYDENEIGKETLRKNLLPNAGAGSAYNAVSSTISSQQIGSGKVEHQFAGTINEDQELYLTAMIDLIGNDSVCNSYQARYGYYDKPLDNLHYEIYQSNSQDAELTPSNAEYIPPVDGALLKSPNTVVNMSGTTRLGVRACYLGSCGDIFELDLSQAQRPMLCSEQ